MPIIHIKNPRFPQVNVKTFTVEDVVVFNDGQETRLSFNLTPENFDIRPLFYNTNIITLYRHSKVFLMDEITITITLASGTEFSIT